MNTHPTLIEVDTREFQARFEKVIANHVPVKVRMLLPETRVPCDFYYPALEGPERNLVLDKVLASGEHFTQDLHETLEREEITEVYIRKDQEGAFQNYLNSIIQEAIHSPHVPTEKKTQLLYDNAEHIVQKVYQERPSRENVKVGRQLVENFSTHISTDTISTDALFSLFSKDYYTFTHSVQVAFLGMSFCKFLGWKPEEITDFGTGALFHDVGKNAIEDSILNKPGKLDRDEFEIIKKHTSLGYEQMRSAQVISKNQLLVVLQHHEAMDGSGYLGLKAYEIHKYARVARIIDVYDALTTKRSYKEAMPPEKALQIMTGDMKATFDEPLLKAFQRFVGLRQARQEQAQAQPSPPPYVSSMDIPIGCPVILRSREGAFQCKATLIGLASGEFLILRLGEEELGNGPPPAGTPFSGRYTHEGTAIDFTTTILGSMPNPVRLLVVSYPQAPERSAASREGSANPVYRVQMEIHETLYPGIAMAINTAGCKLLIKVPINHGGPEALLNKIVTLRIELLKGNEPMPIHGRVRNVKVKDGKTAMSIQFVDLDDATAEQLRNCTQGTPQPSS